jgi:hypothetical protein
MSVRAILPIAATLVGIVAGVSAACADGLSGTVRQEFVNGAIPSCKAQNRNNPRNRDYSDDDIHDYCICYANALADIVTPDDIQRLVETQNTGIGWLMPKINQANAACANNY